MTTRLYWEDPLLFHFDATVLAHGRWGGGPSVVLDRTAFYPEAGGQMADHGLLAGAEVEDVGLDDQGRIHHVLRGTLPEVGARVEGEVDARRRREHMALHTGQHMLSHAILDAAGAKTVSSRLGERVSTLDVDVEVAADAVEEAVAVVNRLIDEDREVRTSFPSGEQLARLPLRRTPKVKEGIRVVEIGGYDFTPCGGTHTTHTGQVQGLAVLSRARHKGGTRLTFLAGPRLRRELWRRSEHLDGLATRFSCAPTDVGPAVENLAAELTLTRGALETARQRLGALRADALLDEAVEGRLAKQLEGELEEAREISRSLTRRGVTTLLAVGAGGRVRVLVSRGEGADFDAGAFLGEHAKALGGGGGGRAEHAEGSVPADAFGELQARFSKT